MTTTEIVGAVLGLGGASGLGAVLIAYFKYKGYREKKEIKEASREMAVLKTLKDQNTVDRALFTEMLTQLRGIDHTLSMGFRHKVNESHQEVMQIKKLAWCKQQDDLYNGLKRIIRANGLIHEEARISDIRDLLQTIVRETDDTLNQFNIRSYMAPTEDKILFICSGEAPKVLYRIITDPKNQDHQKLEDSIRGYGRKILNSVKTEFYDEQGKLKTKNSLNN